MNQRYFKIITILLILFSTAISCKKKSSVSPPGYGQGYGYGYGPGPGAGTGNWIQGNVSQGQACYNWVGTGTPTSAPPEPTVSNSGKWTWYSNQRCYIWEGSQSIPTPPKYEYPPGQQDPNSNSDCYAKGVSAGQGTLPYYRVPVIGHGNPGRLVWSSSQLSSNFQKTLITDGRFNLRIVAKAAPVRGALDYRGINCNYEGLAFTKIKLSVGLRLPNSYEYTHYYDIEGVPVGKCSDVFEFTDWQIPNTAGPFILDIFDFKNDYYCKLYANNPTIANNPAHCPYTPTYSNDCFSIEVQFSTDYTLDIPH